jgi:hypothetical protein
MITDECWQRWRTPQKFDTVFTEVIMLKEDRIEPSDAQVNSPFILAQKPDGNIRVGLDFRASNSITVPDRWWPIRVDQILESFSGCSWFSESAR